MSISDVTLITCAEFPELDPDDRLLANALEAIGLRVNTRVWSDRSVDWSASKLCLIRSTWDYDRRQLEFIDWLKQASSITRLYNDASLIRWNIDKSYLQSLAEKGIKIIPTRWLNADDGIYTEKFTEELKKLIEQLGRDLVLKPTVGLGGGGVVRINLTEQNETQFESSLRYLQKSGKVMIQPFVQSVLREGEHSLVFFEGLFSHAIRKSPFAKLAYAGQAGEAKIIATTEEIQFGLAVLAQLPQPPLYARVDVVSLDEQIHLMELELIEPSLYFSYSDNAEKLLAALIAMKLL
ncbi:MAG: hypothetical protein P4L53_23305 [Candidatus Obscuribacterales bacterium]|nr:hypothetical protein [Candidatus Obscuribacterales bacterium]